MTTTIRHPRNQARTAQTDCATTEYTIQSKQE